MRITGGMFRGRRLQSVQAAVLRPTQDRVREALFSALADALPGCSFLDLYAGTGSVGIEAWSRGAARVCWVEGNRRIFSVLERNVRDLADAVGGVTLEPRCMNAVAFFRQVQAGQFDIVYADPPYARNRNEAETVLPLLAGSPLLRAGGLMVLEQGADEAVPEHPAWDMLRERRYGSSMLRFFRMKGQT